MRAEFSHEISIPLPVDEAFPLFTPKGEELWVPGWAPVYVSPSNGETEEEMVFMTGSGADLTLWTCLRWQPEIWHVRYQRTTPGSRIAFVDVRCRPDGASVTGVRVGYAYVPLSEAGRVFIDALSADTHAATIDSWADKIGNYLHGQPSAFHTPTHGWSMASTAS